jgi:hypothetical protein
MDPLGMALAVRLRLLSPTDNRSFQAALVQGALRHALPESFFIHYLFRDIEYLFIEHFIQSHNRRMKPGQWKNNNSNNDDVWPLSRRTHSSSVHRQAAGRDYAAPLQLNRNR